MTFSGFSSLLWWLALPNHSMLQLRLKSCEPKLNFLFQMKNVTIFLKHFHCLIFSSCCSLQQMLWGHFQCLGLVILLSLVGWLIVAVLIFFFLFGEITCNNIVPSIYLRLDFLTCVWKILGEGDRMEKGSNER